MRKLLSAVLASILVMSLAACGAGKTTQSADNGSQSQAAPSSSQSTDSGKSGGVVKIICPYGVGGTADAIARKYALVAGKLYPQYNFIVENMTGGDGFAAAAYFTDLDASTKELLIYGYGVAYRHDIGSQYQTEVVDFDRSKISPVATIDDRTWILYAKPGTTLEEVIEKAKNGGIKMSGGNPLSDPHLALGSLMALEGGKVMVVPYDGGANQKKGLMDGEVDVFVGTTQAGQEETEAGTLVPILAFSNKPFEGFVTPEGPVTIASIAGEGMSPALNAATDYSGSILPAGGFIATRVGADQAWSDELVEISKAVWADPEYSDWISEILLNKFELYGDEANAYLNQACEKAVKAFETLK